jgi:hypothetical protein
MSDIREEASLCADILEAFSEPWSFAKRSARVFRQLAATNNDDNSTSLVLNHTGFSAEMAVREANRKVLQDIQVQVNDLVHDMMGEASVYKRSLDAATEASREKNNSQVLEQLGAEAAGGGYATAWMDGVWEGVGQVSMDFI